jgi:hypothetical protein
MIKICLIFYSLLESLNVIKINLNLLLCLSFLLVIIITQVDDREIA